MLQFDQGSANALCARGEHPVERIQMAYFADDNMPERGVRPRRVRIGWGILCVGIVGLLGLSLAPAPFAIERPGPVFNTLGAVAIDGSENSKKQPLIEIPGQKIYATAGELSMLTVNVVGNREQQPNWVEVLSAWADPSQAVLPIEALYPKGETVKQSNEQSTVDMQNSQKDAVAAALLHLGYPLTRTLTVSSVPTGSPSEGLLKSGDKIVSVDGKNPTDVDSLRQLIATHGTATPITIDIVRGGTASAIAVTPTQSSKAGSKPLVGIIVGADYNFPFAVNIQLHAVGGPSAGMMFALGIIDKLTPGELNGGKNVAGTGTITADGVVGPIGGIRQKLYGAVNSGARYFLAPTENCAEVTGHIPSGLRVFAVSTLDDSLAVLDAIARGKDLASLASCPAG